MVWMPHWTQAGWLGGKLCRLISRIFRKRPETRSLSEALEQLRAKYAKEDSHAH